MFTRSGPACRGPFRPQEYSNEETAVPHQKVLGLMGDIETQLLYDQCDTCHPRYLHDTPPGAQRRKSGEASQRRGRAVSPCGRRPLGRKVPTSSSSIGTSCLNVSPGGFACGQ